MSNNVINCIILNKRAPLYGPSGILCFSNTTHAATYTPLNTAEFPTMLVIIQNRFILENSCNLPYYVIVSNLNPLFPYDDGRI